MSCCWGGGRGKEPLSGEYFLFLLQRRKIIWMWKNIKYMSWKQSKRRSPLFSNKTRFWLRFLLEIPLILKPEISERTSFTRQEALGKREKSLDSTWRLPQVVREVHPGAQLSAFKSQLCHFPATELYTSYFTSLGFGLINAHKILLLLIGLS